MMLMPVPVVVDADVLIRNVEYTIRKGWAGALLGRASGGYSLSTGVVLFAAAPAGGEAIRHLPEVAERQGVDLQMVRATWNSLIVPNVRFVKLRDDAVSDPRIEGVHWKDVPTAILASLLAPAVLATDNRKHFRPFGLPDEIKTDAVAIDLYAVGQYGTGVNSATLVPRLSGAMAVEGAKKASAKLGNDAVALIGLVILGGLFLFLLSERGRSFRAKVGEAAREYGPPLMERVAEGMAAGERVGEFAIERVGDPDALAVLARHLAVAQTMMSTVDVAGELRRRGYSFRGGVRHETATRAWLMREPCFHEFQHGHWAFGYRAAVL
ncbi:MAG TPA: hypothetical protein VK790_05085 [Solirubrobacteraceae bacterium]|jgi:hypothetical protein|nr:hypothetical protein [Solirubrobacteraceae bacterium]